VSANAKDPGVEMHERSSLNFFGTSVFGIAIVRVRVRPVSIIANKLDLLHTNTPGSNWLVLSPSPSGEAREDEGNEQDAASGSQGDDCNEQVLLLSLEVIERLGIRGGGGVTIARSRGPDIRSLDTLGGEKLRTVRIDGADGIVTLRANTIDIEVRDDIPSASRLLGNTQVTVTVLLDESGAIAQPTSNERGVKKGSGRIGLISDDDNGVLQGAVPRTGEPFDSTSGPSVAVMTRLRKLDADWTWPIRRML